MSEPLRRQLGELCRAGRSDLDITQAELARAVGISRGYLAGIETGRANVTFDVATRIGAALGLGFSLAAARPVVVAPRQVDFVHARCSAFVQRRLRTAGFECAREVGILDGRVRGWIDLLAFHAPSGLLLLIEVKTALDDVGRAERQLGWYERHARTLARARGWHVRTSVAWLLVLATEDVDRAVRDNRETLGLAFPGRAAAMRRLISPPDGIAEPASSARRGLALIDPSSRRRAWLQPSRVDGRKRRVPFRDYADAAGRLRRARS